MFCRVLQIYLDSMTDRDLYRLSHFFLSLFLWNTSHQIYSPSFSLILLWNDDCQVEISHFFDYRLFVFFCVILIKDIGQETSIQIYRRLATLLFVDWLPQVNGFAASFFVYSRESNLWNKKCLHRIILNNFNHLLIEISCPIASILFLLLSIYFNNDNLKFYLISLNPSINYINQYDLS